MEQRRVPRDVLVNMLTKKMKDEILKLSFLNPMEVKGKKVIIMKELPKQLLVDRKIFRKLTDRLKKRIEDSGENSQ